MNDGIISNGAVTDMISSGVVNLGYVVSEYQEA